MTAGTSRPLPARLVWCAAALLVLTLSPAPVRAQAPTWERALDDAERAYLQGRYDEAERLLAGAVRQAETFGPNDPRLARTLTTQATLYRLLGRYGDAEPLYLRAIGILEKAAGREDAALVGALNDYGFVRQYQGRYTEAGEIYHRALDIAAKSLPQEHPVVATVLTNLASLYQAQGRYAEAEPLYRGALRIAEKTLGADDVVVARALSRLASLY